MFEAFGLDIHALIVELRKPHQKKNLYQENGSAINCFRFTITFIPRNEKTGPHINARHQSYLE